MIQQHQIDRVIKLARKIHPRHNFEGHILPVARIAQGLCDKLDADPGVVAVASYLHDAGRVRFGCWRHDRTGSYYVRLKLWQYSFPKEDAAHVVACVLSHGGHYPTESLEASIVANADALSHFECVNYEFAIRYSHGLRLAPTIVWLERKLEYDLAHKLTLPDAKDAALKHYEAIQFLLNSLKERSAL
jgi:HD superfamily phosphodiesterase